MATLWLSKHVFTWRAEFDAGRRSDAQRVFRPHELLAHSERLLRSTPDEFGRADAVLGLKRAVNSRLQHLEELYAFSAAFPKSVGPLERLEVVGLARPLLIRTLFTLRNDIEHNDTSPPNAERCSELLDATWYFLKTTDYACKVVPTGVVLSNGHLDQTTDRLESLTVRITAPSPELEIHGWLLPESLSSDERPDSIAVREESTEIGDLANAFAIAQAGLPLSAAPPVHGRRSFFGRASGNDEVRQRLWSRMLETL